MSSSRVLPPLAPRAALRWDLVRRILVRIRPNTVLEIGCGQGAFGARLAESGSGYLAVEPDPTSAARARERVEPFGGVVRDGDDSAVEPGRLFDLVCAFEVLEHIEHDRAALRSWAKFVGPGGALIVSVPAFQHRFGPMDTRAGHFRRYSPAELTELFASVGFTDVEVRVYAWPLGYALEVVRNRIDARMLAANAHLSVEELTAASGRTAQPSRQILGRIITIGVAPFQVLQRLAPHRGTGLVAIARRA